jgi:hypothetical protein
VAKRAGSSARGFAPRDARWLACHSGRFHSYRVRTDRGAGSGSGPCTTNRCPQSQHDPGNQRRLHRIRA